MTLCLDAVTNARKLGLTVSCDYNFRGNLGRYGQSPSEVVRTIVQQVHDGVAGRGGCHTMLGITPRCEEPEGALNCDWYRALAEQPVEAFPNLHMQVITLREGNSATNYGWSLCLRTRKELLTSRLYEIADLVDRVRTRDSFTAGLMYELMDAGPAQYTLEFATAASCLKHTIVADVNRVSAAEVYALLNGQSGGRMQRQELS
ncbi:MAG: hypothetical protein ABJC26_03570 [Gemmatimonadaceae bacterium]